MYIVYWHVSILLHTFSRHSFPRIYVFRKYYDNILCLNLLDKLNVIILSLDIAGVTNSQVLLTHNKVFYELTYQILIFARIFSLSAV